MAGILQKIKDGIGESAQGWAQLAGLPVWTKPKPVANNSPSRIKQEVEYVEGGELLPGLVGNYSKFNSVGQAFPQLQPVNQGVSVGYNPQQTQASNLLMNRSWATEPVNMYKSPHVQPNMYEKLPTPNRSVLDYLDQI